MMTTRQDKYARNLVKGMSQRQAYRDAYPSSKTWKDEVVDAKASNLAKNGKVAARTNELKRKADEAAVGSRQRRLELLWRIAERNEELAPAASIAAVKVLNDMTGDNAPVKAEVSVDILAAIAARHRSVIEEEED